MRMKPLFHTFSAIAFVLFLFTADAMACECVRPRPTVADELERYTKVVVTGRIESVHKIRDEERKDDYWAYRSATLVVDKVFMGNVKVGDRLVLAQGSGSDCAFTWEPTAVGSKWLFYLGDPSTRYHEYIEQRSLKDDEKISMYGTSFCGRSTTSDSAARDLAFLENIAKRKGSTRVSGDLRYYDRSGRSVEGIQVRITGKEGTFKTKYLKNGYFEIYDMPPGEYIFEVMAPFGWTAVNDHFSWPEFDREDDAKLKKNQRYIRVTEGGHTDVNLGLVPDTLVKGRIISPIGKPMSKVCLSLVSLQNTEPERDKTECTEQNGEFKFEHMPPGNYRLEINPNGKIDDEHPFGKLYYPGVSSEAHAGVISVDAGKHTLGLQIQIPQTVRLIDVIGVVLFDDDKPAAGASVKFESSDKGKFDEVSTRTDDSGRFSMRIPYGAVGTIRSTKYFSKYSYSECPKIMEFVTSSGPTDVNTTSLEVSGTEPTITTTLRFPFDFCPEK
jgi:hypothetical protein